MSRRAVEARAAARKAAARTERRAGQDVGIREEIQAAYRARLADFALVVCDDCGLEQVDARLPCVLCGCETATTSPRHEITLSGLALRLGVDDTETVRETQTRR